MKIFDQLKAGMAAKRAQIAQAEQARLDTAALVEAKVEAYVAKHSVR